MLVIDLCQSRSIATSAAWGHGIKTQVLLDSWIAFTSHWLNKHSAIPTSKQDTWDCWGIFILISLVWALVFLSSGITRREPKMIKGFLSYCGTRTSYGAFMRFPQLAFGRDSSVGKESVVSQLFLVGTGVPATTLASEKKASGLPAESLGGTVEQCIPSHLRSFLERIKLHSMVGHFDALWCYLWYMCLPWGYVICTNYNYIKICNNCNMYQL